ncbi:hypothetical protein ABTA63_19920, partial [Acinetobacter baumannii]
NQNYQAVIHKLSCANFSELKKAMEALAIDEHSPIHIWEITEYRDNTPAPPASHDLCVLEDDTTLFAPGKLYLNKVGNILQY